MSNETESPEERRRRLRRERKRRYLHRIRRRRGVARVEYTEGMLDALVSAGMLSDSAADDRDAISRAIGTFVALSLGRKKNGYA